MLHRHKCMYMVPKEVTTGPKGMKNLNVYYLEMNAAKGN